RRGGRRTALVIGDPRGGGSPLSPLPGAQQEAAAVASLLEESGFAVTRLIGDAASPAQVVAALFSRSWSVVHVASHGVAGWQPRPEDPPMTGIVLGAPPLDVLEAPLLAQLPEPPDLVFLNCCHLGRISADGPFSGALRQDRPGFASSLAVELIERGCPAVVACGWAVQDDAAMRFAQGLFTELCAGADFGTAVRQARSATHAASAAMGSLDNTWGAYQCYGHPGFGLIDARPERRLPQSDPASPAEALAEVRAYGSRLDILGRDAVIAHLSVLGARIRENGWQGCSDLAAALGDAHAACGQLELAAECYGRAAGAEVPTLPLTALQESAPLLSRGDAGRLQTAVALLESLNTSCGDSLRRHVLLADLHRRRAILAGTAKTRQEALRRQEAALDRALTLADAAQSGRPGRAETDRLRLQHLLVQALLTHPPKALEDDFRQLSARMDMPGRPEPLLALVGAVVTGDPAALSSTLSGTLSGDAADSLAPDLTLALAALPARSPLRETLERLRDRLRAAESPPPRDAAPTG
uniref:CHAT domain-containing protein n=1 Tax=Paracoccus binzhouensis TaxID=2796149 RepID=UPI0018EF2722